MYEKSKMITTKLQAFFNRKLDCLFWKWRTL